MSTVRVRFAPSPTGTLHVGGARTAIFNWLYARGQDGTFVLRIEDTDRERSTAEMVQAILDGMSWLGLSPDEGPTFQSEARDDHALAARTLLERGLAYRCFCSAEDLRAEREAAQQSGGGWRYPSRCRDLDPGEARRRADGGEACAVRFAVPAGEIRWEDRVHGSTTFDGGELEDFVLLRSDGSPTYMLSVVCDDAAAEITDVIRGDDHLTNTPKQILLYRALGHDEPRFAHLPLILGTDKKRLSKRHGAVSVLEYRDRGYLPEAVFNFLALLGWNPRDDREKMDREALVQAFSFRGVGRSGAVFDLAKLEWLNGQYIDEQPVASLIDPVRERLSGAGLWREGLDGARSAWLEELVALLQPRARTLDDFVDLARPFLAPTDALEYEEKASRKHLKGDAGERLRRLRDAWSAIEGWEAPELEEALRSLAEAMEISAGKLIHPARLAATGRGASPGLFDVVALLGRQTTLARLDRLLGRLDDGNG